MCRNELGLVPAIHYKNPRRAGRAKGDTSGLEPSRRKVGIPTSHWERRDWSERTTVPIGIVGRSSLVLNSNIKSQFFLTPIRSGIVHSDSPTFLHIFY